MKLPYKVIVSLLGAIVLLLQSLGLKIEGECVNEIITGVAGLLVTFGIVAPEPKKEQTIEESAKDDEKTE